MLVKLETQYSFSLFLYSFKQNLTCFLLAWAKGSNELNCCLNHHWHHCKLFTFLSSLEPLDQSTKLGTKNPTEKVFQIKSNNGLFSFQRGDNKKTGLDVLKIFLHRTTQLISNKLGTKHSWQKGFQVCSYEGPFILQREVKIINWRKSEDLVRKF